MAGAAPLKAWNVLATSWRTFGLSMFAIDIMSNVRLSVDSWVARVMTYRIKASLIDRWPISGVQYFVCPGPRCQLGCRFEDSTSSLAEAFFDAEALSIAKFLMLLYRATNVRMEV